MEKVGIPEL